MTSQEKILGVRLGISNVRFELEQASGIKGLKTKKEDFSPGPDEAQAHH